MSSDPLDENQSQQKPPESKKPATKQELMEDLELLVLKGLVAKMRAGEATSSEFNTATQLLAKSGALARTGGAGKGNDEWTDYVMGLPSDEFERFVESLRAQRAEGEARAVATRRKKRAPVER